MPARAYTQTIGRAVGVARPPTLSVQPFERALLAITRLSRKEIDPAFIARPPRRDGFAVNLSLRDVPAFDFWIDGRPVRAPAARSGTLRMLDLNLETAIHITHPFDFVHVYVPRATFDAFAEEGGGPRIETLHAPQWIGIEDSVVRGLGAALLPALRRPQHAEPLFLEHVAMALLSHLARFYGESSSVPRLQRGGLAPWQERRAKEILIHHLDGDVSLAQLARESGLSRSHFARAFKITTGQPPHRWLSARRVERARELLREPGLSLAEISDRCGFADQSHFTRVFARAVGVTPGEWRRHHG